MKSEKIREVRRGYDIKDEKWFSKENTEKMRTAQEEIVWLLDRNYKMQSIIELVSNKNQFSKKQKMALVRSTTSTEKVKLRNNKKLKSEEINGETVHIDGFNIIITLEVAISNSSLFLGNDGVIRDLAGLRGTYKIVDKTYEAIRLLGEELDQKKVKKAIFYLDQPVSNSGKLKKLIDEMSQEWKCHVEVEIVRNPDVILMKLENIISADEVILDNCISWYNINREIIDKHIKEKTLIDIS